MVTIADQAHIPIAEGPVKTYFVLQIKNHNDDEHPLLNIGIDGKITDLEKIVNFSYPPSTSSDDNWAVITDKNKTYLYSSQLEPIKSWDVPYSKIIWRSDSTGFFLSSYSNLYYVSMNDKELELLDICPSQDCSIREYVWLP